MQCLRSNQCKINLQTRSDCSACRLDKCLALGMNPKLIGKRFGNRNKSRPNHHSKNTFQSKQLETLSLLENDRSLLSNDEWTLLSNLVHTYDNLDVIPYTRRFIQCQSALPLKSRLKASAMVDYLKYLYSAFQVYVEQTPYYNFLPANTRKDLIVRNSETFGIINSMFIIRETNAMNYPAFRTGADMVYTPAGVQAFNCFISRLDPNNILVQLMLAILAFAPNSSVVNFDSLSDVNCEYDSILIFNVENIFVTMIWKYLLYQYGLSDAVRWFNYFIQYIVNLIRFVYEQRGSAHIAMVDTVIEDTTRLLCLDD